MFKGQIVIIETIFEFGDANSTEEQQLLSLDRLELIECGKQVVANVGISINQTRAYDD